MIVKIINDAFNDSSLVITKEAMREDFAMRRRRGRPRRSRAFLAMKLAPALLAFALGLGSATARADAYTWGGASGRFDVEVTVLGFNEGRGVGGWDEGSARDFAAWAKRFNAVIPRAARSRCAVTPRMTRRS